MPSPPVYLLGRFRLLVDVGEVEAGEYGNVVEILDDEYFIGFFSSIESARAKSPDRLRVQLRANQIRMAAHDLQDWFDLTD